jgi:S1-C subfamily serine protease
VRGSLAVDVIIVVLLLAYLANGIRRGLLLGGTTLVGLLLGAVVGIVVIPKLAAGLEAGLLRAGVVLVGVLVLALVGQTLGAVVGAHFRAAVTNGSARVVDRVLGGLAALVASVVVLAVLLGALRGVPSPGLSRAIGASTVAQAVDRVVPDAVNGLAGGLARTMASGFPRVFEGIGPEVILPVDPPNAEQVGAAAVAAAPSTVKISGTARSCDRTQEGSGFVLSPGRVVTNAHVVAGVTDPSVQVLGQGEELTATVVVFDSDRDLAVLAVPGLLAPPLPQGTELGRGDPAMVIGFPLGGPLTTSPARVRQVLDARGQDIYGRGGVTREVYSLYTQVRPGNSGGPVLDATGALVGVVFATSLDDPDTGYALTLEEAAPVLAAGVKATGAVDVGPCSGR